MPTVSIGGRACFYQDRGEGFPILFGSSYLWPSAMWEPQLKSLSKEFRCIAVDLWDHGQSGHLGTSSPSIEQLADDHWKLMQHLGIHEFAIVGLSVGGMWGTQLALQHREAVKALVLMDTYVGSEPEITRLKYFGMLGMLEKELCFSKALLHQVVPIFFSPVTLKEKPQLAVDFRKELEAIKKENIPGIVALGRAIFSRTSLLDQLPKLQQPTLILVGKDDIPRPPKEAEEMARLMPNTQVGVIANAGHISNLEQPAAVNALLGEYLRAACEVGRENNANARI